jgi:HAD superfamily hydrolase (TIGR01509 family)
MDGVLIDATEWHYQALNQALIDCGYQPIKREDHLSKYNGLPTKQKLKMMGIDDPRVSELKKKYTTQIARESCKPDQEKIEMLSELSINHQLAVCSNAIKSSVTEMLDLAGISSFFDLILGNDEVQNPKPAPDIYLKAMEELSCNPDKTIIIEDSPHGIKAAQSSGAITIAVRGYKNVNNKLFRRLSCLT